jgi:hypothetical protein
VKKEQEPTEMTKTEMSMRRRTVLVEHVSADIIPCSAREDFVITDEDKDGHEITVLSVKAGQRFFLVRSSRFENRFYVVAWQERETIGWTCSCGAAHKSHTHLEKASAMLRVKLAARVAAKVQECQAVAKSEEQEPASFDRPISAQEWKERTKRQKQADRAYKQKILAAATSFAAANRQFVEQSS